MNTLRKRLLRLTDEIKEGKNEKYRGNTVFCPCCGKTFNRFMDFVITRMADTDRYKETYKNTICPYCFSFPRHRIVCYGFEKIIMGGGGQIY